MLVPVGTAVADSVNDTVGGLSVIVLIDVALLVVEPELSVALTYTWYVFAVAYAWLSVVAVPASVSTVPSPHETLRLETVPSGSAALIVRRIVVPVVRLVVDSVKDTVGALSLIVLVAVADFVVWPLLSVALTYTVNVAVNALPVLAYAWLSVVAVPASVSTVPSPHDNLRLEIVSARSAAVIVRVIVVPVV